MMRLYKTWCESFRCNIITKALRNNPDDLTLARNKNTYIVGWIIILAHDPVVLNAYCDAYGFMVPAGRPDAMTPTQERECKLIITTLAQFIS